MVGRNGTGRDQMTSGWLTTAALVLVARGLVDGHLIAGMSSDVRVWLTETGARQLAATLGQVTYITARPA
jgi:hypothetical protein